MSTDISTREGLFKVMRQIVAERAAAKPIVAELLQRKEPPWNDDVPPEWKTAGFVDELTKAAAAILEREPERSITNLHFALAIASDLPQAHSIVNAQLDSDVFKHLTYAHQWQLCLEEAMSAAEASHAVVASQSALAFGRATANYAKAVVYVRAQNFDKAEPLLKASEVIFSEFGDEARMCRCRIVRAAILGLRGGYAEGIELLMQIADTVSEVDPGHTEVVVFEDLAWMLIQSGRLEEAQQFIDRARRRIGELNMPLELDKLAILSGQLSLAAAEYENALSQLGHARSRYLDRGETDAAVGIALDMVDALLALDRTKEARALAELGLTELQDGSYHAFLERAIRYVRELSTSSEQARQAFRVAKKSIERSKAQPHSQMWISPVGDDDQ